MKPNGLVVDAAEQESNGDAQWELTNVSIKGTDSGDREGITCESFKYNSSADMLSFPVDDG
jgi:hypothetical protein